ncbi:MAG TPA: fibronectin type III domain-containing protein, partial [Bacteroidales bacterium]
MFKKLLGILIVISCFSVKTVHGQNIPVQASMVLVPPYTLSLGDYASGVDNKLTLNILLKDLLSISYQVKLRLTIEANGFSITTRPTFVPPPITLQGGVPEMLSGSDIDYYFDPANLDFKGLNKNEYIRSNKLPEGYYKFTIEVLDYNRSSVVSNKATVYAYIVLNDPPLINRPSNNSKVTTIDPVNIVFNWTPRHLGSPNSAFSTEYHFKLVEIWPQGRNAYEAMLTCPPLYEATVQGTSLVYDMMCPQLIPGKEYAFTITAADVNGRDMFKNGGTSETYRFIFGDDCKPPTNLTAKPVAGNGLEISWTTGLSHSGYNVNYRVKGSSTWYSQNTLLSNTRIYQLPPSSVVEYQVNAQCGTVESVFSDIYSAQTGAAGESKTFECGNHKALKAITNKTDVSSLMPGAIINAGGFEARITSVVRNGNGSFTGECIVTIPYLNYAKVPHTFANIKVNELNEMYDGKLISKTNPNSPFVKTVQTQQQTLAANTVQTESGGITADTTITFSGTNIVIDSVYYANDSTLVIVTNEGTQTVEQKDGEKTLVTDPKGNQYLANGGNVNKVGGEGVASGEAQASVVDNVKTASAKLPVLEFYPAGNARYGFDKVKYDALAKAYKEEKIQGTPYSIPWKAIETGGVDYVEVNTPNKSDSFDPASMSYAKESGGKIAFTPAPSGNVQLLVTSGEADDYESIEATYLLKDTSGKEKQALLGKLNVATYNKQSINLRIVPVNNDNTSTGELQSKLNEIYGQAVTGYNVQVLSNFDVDGLSSTATFEDAGTGALSHYTDDMKKIYNAFKKSGVTIDKEAYYIFLVPMGTSNGRAGFMPLGSQWGFIFTKNAGTNVAQTIAHELGHGAFKLYHTFSSNNKYTLTPNSTDNLMDYNNGVAL